MANKVDRLALAIVLVAAALTALFLQGFWSLVFSFSTCGDLLWYTVLAVAMAVVVFYAYERNSQLMWGFAVVLLLVYVIVMLLAVQSPPPC